MRHNIHTSLIAGGSYVEGSSFFGYASGIARGIAPTAQVAVYEAVWNGGLLYPIAITTFEAEKNTIFVSASADNSSYVEGSSFFDYASGITRGIASMARVLNVAVGPIDRDFEWSIKLGNGSSSRGLFFYLGNFTFQEIPLVFIDSCEDENNPEKIRGAGHEIVVVCLDTTNVLLLQLFNEQNMIKVVVAALFKSAAHPKWNLVIIHSMLMTMEYVLDNMCDPIKDIGFNDQPASPLAMAISPDLSLYIGASVVHHYNFIQEFRSDGWYSTTLDSAATSDTTTTLLEISSDNSSILSSKLIYTYTKSINGFSEILSPYEHAAIKNSSGFISSVKDLKIEIHTTHYYQFLGLNSYHSAWPRSDYGKDVLIGVVDTGV
ncbi:hypothetical protein BUALT_Bualt01G0038600 [Buddleja alternifolia]|uniref:Inhibitor I9 domain-containing protein n=1 Tax=Buddleja alternifolia TaxID=168488 RepID=A0AAV6YES9_9LAMI|nr:hypothetical protein BUALT_Bualt01G0038600 [Buddleja alternifolia]